MRVPALSQALALTRSAVTNAQHATGLLSTAVGERLSLTRSLDAPSPTAGPGTLVRLSQAEAQALLVAGSVGRLAYIARAGVPDIVPVNYRLDGSDILICSGHGPKLQAAERQDTVAFEVDDLDHTGRAGWSVVVQGRARRLGDAERAKAAASGVLPQPWAQGPRHHVLRISPTRVEGRRIVS